MKKLISAASSLVMAASMIGSAVPFATGAADTTKGFELRTFPNKAGETVSTTISEDAIKAGDVTIPIGVYFKENTTDTKSIMCQWTVDSKDGDASNKNVVFTPYNPGDAYFDEAQEVTLADGSSGSLKSIVGFCGTIKKDRFRETNEGTYSTDEKQTSWGCPNSWGSVIWLSPVDGVYSWSGKTSDEYPMFVFEATFKKGTPAGTYSINFLDAEDDKKVQATMVEAAGGTRYALPQKNLDVKGIDIVIGGPAAGTTTAATTTAATTTAAPETTTTTPGGNTNPTQGEKPTHTNPSDFETAADFILTGDDITAKPGETVEVSFKVSNPGKHASVFYTADVEGIKLPAGMTFEMSDDEIYAIDGDTYGVKYYKNMDYTYQADVTHNKTKDPAEVTEGESIIQFDVTIPDDIADGVYYFDFKSFKVVENAQEPVKLFYATIIPGSITIGDGGAVTTTSSAATTTSSAATTTTTSSAATTTSSAAGTTTTAPVGTPLYGDTNCDNKVNIADVVLLNKWLNDAKSYDISDQGKLNADCCDAKGGAGLDKNDSDAIIRKIVHLVELPCASADLK